MPDLSRLTEAQRRVALAGDGPLLVVAGPGSGKTTTMAARIAHLVEDRHVAPACVLAITFTRAAAQALRGRLTGMLGEPGRAVDVTTFHGFGLRVVRHWSDLAGYPPGALRVCGDGASRALLREAARAASVEPRRTPAKLERAVERHRLAAGAADADGATGSPGTGAGRSHVLARLAADYEALLLQRRLVDYPAMLVLPVRLLRAHPHVLRVCQDAYRAILADEFQDVCVAQYELLRLLASGHRNLAVVGDPNQSVYAWRGADPGLFERFVRDFPDARVHHLDQNFRSTGAIVGLANALGAGLGAPPRLWTENAAGYRAVLYAAADEEDEAAFVAGEIRRLLDAGGVSHLGEVGVLYRTNAQARVLQRALGAAGLAYRLDPGSLLAGDGDDAADAADLLDLADQTPRVTLATIHAAKGNEWRAVFVVGVEEGLLPHGRAGDSADPAGPPQADPDSGGPAEELRVAYVAVTRPRERLYLSYCRRRGNGGWSAPADPSRFLRRLPPELLASAPPAA